MNLRVIFGVMICTALLLSMTACNKAPDDDGTAATAPPTTPTTVAIIEEKLEDMLTVEEISKAVGAPMGTPSISGQGTILTSIGTDSKAVLNVEVSEKPIAIFNQMLQYYPDLQPCPNLGESAWFSPVYNQLLVYENDFMITVELTGTSDGDHSVQMLRCRQIAALLLEHL